MKYVLKYVNISLALFDNHCIYITSGKCDFYENPKKRKSLILSVSRGGSNANKKIREKKTPQTLTTK